MKPMDFNGRWVLVTGASSGLGWEMAKVLATRHGANVVVVARRMSRLEELKKELESTSRAKVVPIAADLSRVDEVDRVFQEATAAAPLYGAILNAGITHFGEYHELSWSDFEMMLATNVTGVVRLTTKIVPYLESRGEGGGVLLVSSMAGLTPVPYQTAYSATKAFLVNFGCGLHHETQDRGVSVTTFVPGGIKTEMTSGERFEALGGWLMPADRCALEAIDCFRRRKYLHVPGVVMRVGTALMGVVPQRFLTSRVAATYRGALEKVRKGAQGSR
jgi:short-subunit dehydrogenase